MTVQWTAILSCCIQQDTIIFAGNISTALLNQGRFKVTKCGELHFLHADRTCHCGTVLQRFPLSCSAMSQCSFCHNIACLVLLQWPEPWPASPTRSCTGIFFMHSESGASDPPINSGFGNTGGLGNAQLQVPFARCSLPLPEKILLVQLDMAPTLALLGKVCLQKAMPSQYKAWVLGQVFIGH